MKDANTPSHPRLWRKKPVAVQAILFVPKNAEQVKQFISNGGGRYTVSPDHLGQIGIVTLEGTMWASHGDYVIRGVQGEFYPCKPDIFDVTYEAAE